MIKEINWVKNGYYTIGYSGTIVICHYLSIEDGLFDLFFRLPGMPVQNIELKENECRAFAQSAFDDWCRKAGLHACNGEYTHDNLLAGEYPRIERVVTIAAGADLARGAVLGRIFSTGKFKLSASTSVDGSQEPEAILAEKANAANNDVQAVVYCSGEFNENALVLGAGHTLDSVRLELHHKKNIYLRPNLDIDKSRPKCDTDDEKATRKPVIKRDRKDIDTSDIKTAIMLFESRLQGLKRSVRDNLGSIDVAEEYLDRIRDSLTDKRKRKEVIAVD